MFGRIRARNRNIKIKRPEFLCLENKIKIMFQRTRLEFQGIHG